MMEIRKRPNSMRRYTDVVSGPIVGYGIDGSNGSDDTVKFEVAGETHRFEVLLSIEEWKKAVKLIEKMRKPEESRPVYLTAVKTKKIRSRRPAAKNKVKKKR